MKAISIREPYASMIRRGEKTIETRTWKTDYRGFILLCASKKPDGFLAGNAFAIGELVDVRPMVKEDEKRACCEVYDGAYSWVFENIFPITPCFKVKRVSLGCLKLGCSV